MRRFRLLPTSKLGGMIGRVIIEAMAVGVPVILPHVFEPLFKDSAIHATPSEVPSTVDKIMDDDALYEAQVTRATTFIKQRFGYSRHERRLSDILAKKIV